MQFKNEAVQLKVGTGIKIDPMEAHQMRNVSDGEMFLRQNHIEAVNLCK